MIHNQRGYIFRLHSKDSWIDRLRTTLLGFPPFNERPEDGVSCVSESVSWSIPVACIATLMNATLNDVDVQVSWKNLLNEPLKETYDVIFIGDLLYEEELAETLIPWLLDASKKGTRIFLGDPGRHGLTSNLKKYLKLLCRYKLPENTRKENNGYHEVCVWQFVN